MDGHRHCHIVHTAQLPDGVPVQLPASVRSGLPSSVLSKLG